MSSPSVEGVGGRAGVDAGHATIGVSFDPLRWQTRALLGAFVLEIVLSVVAIVSDVSYHGLIGRLANGSVSLADAQAADHRQSVIGLVQIGLFIATATLFIVWFSRAYRNLDALGVSALRWSNGWAVGGWFVPFLNLVRPKQLANDIWRGSDPERPPSTHLPREGSTPWYYEVWWGLFVVAAILSRIAYQRSQDADTPSAISSATDLLIASDIAYLVGAVLAIAVVLKTAERQRQRARAIEAARQEVTAEGMPLG